MRGMPKAGRNSRLKCAGDRAFTRQRAASPRPGSVPSAGMKVAFGEDLDSEPENLLQLLLDSDQVPQGGASGCVDDEVEVRVLSSLAACPRPEGPGPRRRATPNSGSPHPLVLR